MSSVYSSSPILGRYPCKLGNHTIDWQQVLLSRLQSFPFRLRYLSPWRGWHFMWDWLCLSISRFSIEWMLSSPWTNPYCSSWKLTLKPSKLELAHKVLWPASSVTDLYFVDNLLLNVAFRDFSGLCFIRVLLLPSKLNSELALAYQLASFLIFLLEFDFASSRFRFSAVFSNRSDSDSSHSVSLSVWFSSILSLSCQGLFQLMAIWGYERAPFQDPCGLQIAGCSNALYGLTSSGILVSCCLLTHLTEWASSFWGALYIVNTGWLHVSWRLLAFWISEN